jgi:hypothetical protein
MNNWFRGKVDEDYIESVVRYYKRRSVMDFSCLKKRYEIRGTEEFGPGSCRRLYFVKCLDCGEVLHPAAVYVWSACKHHDGVECDAKIEKPGPPPIKIKKEW